MTEIAETANIVNGTTVVGVQTNPYIDFASRISNQERECRIAEAKVELISEQLTEVKAAVKVAFAQLRQLASESPDPPSGALTVGGSKGVGEEVRFHASKHPKSDTPKSDAWRNFPISKMQMKEIKGFGKSKIGHFTKLCSTLGHFADLNSKAADGKVPLHELLSKGIGKEIADALVKAFDQALMSSQDEEKDVEDLAIEKRGEELDTGKEGCLAPELESHDIWQSGFDTFKRGGPITDCAWTDGDQQDDWLRGWMSAEQIKAISVDGSNEEPAKKEESLSVQSQIDAL